MWFNQQAYFVLQIQYVPGFENKGSRGRDPSRDAAAFSSGARGRTPIPGSYFGFIDCTTARNSTFSGMRLFLATLIGAVLANAPAVMACEGCKEPSSVAGNGGVDGISFGFSASVVFMLIMVGSILSGLAWMMARSCRQLDEAHRSASAQSNWSS